MSKTTSILPLCFALTLSPTINADTVFLNNGDRISGSIATMHKSELVLKTSYSEITIPWADIKNIDSNQPITVELSDGSQLKGLLVQTNQGPGIKSDSLSATVPLSFNNISALNPPVISDNAIVTGGVHVGGSKSSGNTDNQEFHADAEVIARTGNNKFSAGIEYNQAANDGDESENNLYIFSQYDHYFMPKWYASLFMNFTKDKFQALDSRSAFGAGLGHEFWDTKRSFLSGEIGVAYTIENFEEPLEDREFIAGRWAIDYNYWILEDRLQFFHDHEGLISFEDFSDLLYRSHTGFKIPVWQGFEVLAQYDFDYDTKPAEGKKSADTRYIIGVGYTW